MKKSLEQKTGITILSDATEEDLRPTPEQQESLRQLFEWQKESARMYWDLGEPTHAYRFDSF